MTTFARKMERKRTKRVAVADVEAAISTYEELGDLKTARWLRRWLERTLRTDNGQREL